MEASVTYQVTSVLSQFDSRRDMSRDNLTPQQRAALKSLKSKKSELRFLPADKGNATMVLTHNQYLDKVNEHLSSGSYTLLPNDPTQSITNKLYRVLKKLRDEHKITPDMFTKMRNLHPRWPQLYGQPKIHKQGAPIRPVVSFYNTPLQALHKVLATYLKPLAQNPLRLKDSSDFKQRLESSLDPSFPYHCSLDVQALYTSCDMRLATKTAITSFEQNPGLLPSNLTSTTLGTLITFCLDNSYLEFNGCFYSQDVGGTMGSPLIVELAEIRLAEVETMALSSSPDPPSSYSHFVDDGCGAFRDKDHAETYLTFLNSLTEDLNFTMEHPSCLDCTSTYNGQTYRPLIHRMKEHERCHRLNNAYDETLDKVKSAPAHHSLTTGHRIAWNDITILKSLPSKAHLDLTEQAAIHIRNPSMNRTDSAPKCSSLWNPILPKIAATLKPTPSGITFSSS
ncbi:hypothetical protein ACHWQZ_G003605 [Mnemiopsis leidyi]